MEVPEFDAGYWLGQGWTGGHIGATNWNNLKTSGQYTDYQLGQSTQKVGNDIFWNPNVNITDIPKVPNQLPVTEMGTGSGLSNLPAPEPLNDIPGLMAATKPTEDGIKSYLEQAQAQLPSQQKKDAITERISTETEASKNIKDDTRKEMWERFQMQPNVEQLQKILPQMASLQANAARLQEENRNRPISSRIIGGTQDRLARQQAAEMAGLGAMAEAYQGNIEMARTLSQDAINAKYADQENYINNLKSQLSFIEQDLGREETTKLNQLQAVLSERERLIGEQKEMETNISNVMLAAAQNGADQATLEKIMKAFSYTDAIRLASKYLDQTESKWTESDITDSSGNPMLFNPSTGEYKTALGTSTSDIFFTDANGDSWNIAGWATDQTKPQQMNAIAKRIGKLTDDNLAEKVKEFTPALTPEMIKEASAMSGISWEAIMTMVVQESLGGTSNVAKANNNFGGLTFNNQEWIKPFGGVKGTARPSAEGGNYIKFPTKQEGLNAMAALMASYGKVEPEATTPQTSSAQNWANLISTGQATIANVPAEERSAVADALALTPSPKDTLDDIVAKEKAQIALDLMDHKGLDSAVGITRLGRTAALWNMGKKQDFIASVEQLVNGLSLESLIEAKSRGATFGALSDTEMRILSSSATKIGSWKIYDKTGKTVGYKVNEKAMKDELAKINTILLRSVNKKMEADAMIDPLEINDNPLGL